MLADCPVFIGKCLSREPVDEGVWWGTVSSPCGVSRKLQAMCVGMLQGENFKFLNLGHSKMLSFQAVSS